MNTTNTQNLIAEANTRANNGTNNEAYGTNTEILEAIIDEHASIAVAIAGMEIMIRDTRDQEQLETAHNAMYELINNMHATIKELRSAEQNLATKETLKEVQAVFAKWGHPSRAAAVDEILNDLGTHLYL